MTIASPETAGPNITSGSEIKFSTLRKYFLKMNPRSSFTDSDTNFEPETGSVSASQLLRVSSLDSVNDGTIEEEYEINYRLPFVPDCTENSNIATENDWKPSQFVGSIKYYYLRQSTSDDLNLDLTSQSWNSNLPLTIRKWFFVDGTIGSNDTNPSLIISSTANYLSLKLSSTGRIYGSAGAAGTNGVNEGRGGDGGDAVSWTDVNSLYNNYIILHPDSKLYGGGGGGGKGGNGGEGGDGAHGGRNNIGCTGVGAGGYSCTLNLNGRGGRGRTKIGPDGGTGRGYSNLTGSIAGTNGGKRNSGTQGGSGSSRGGDSGLNGNGGSGGEFGQPGNIIPSTAGTRGLGAVTGTAFGESATCGGNNKGHFFRTCHSITTQPDNGTITNGTSGSAGGSAGKAILKSPTTSFTVVGGGTDTIKGDDQPINYALSDFYQFVPYSIISDGTSNILLLVRDKDTIDTVEQSISVDMNVICDTQGIISQSTRITEIERFNFNQIAVTVTPSFNAFNTGPEFNFYS